MTDVSSHIEQSSEGRTNGLQRILVPTDFSADADEAFRVACRLARAIGAEVVVVHVAPPPAVVTDGGGALVYPDSGKTVNLRDYFRGIRPPDPSVRVEHHVIVADRSCVQHILELLEQQGCDLIVMGTYGTSGEKEGVCGGVTQEVVRLAHCPVMVVKAPSLVAREGAAHST